MYPSSIGSTVQTSPFGAGVFTCTQQIAKVEPTRLGKGLEGKLEPMIENSFSRMGTTVKVLLPAGDEAMLDFVQARSWNLEALWSRFIGTSDIAMLALADKGITELVAAQRAALAA